MKSKTVAVVISRWSPEEREKFKDLVKECQEREIGIFESSKKLQSASQELEKQLNELTAAHERLRRESEKLLDTTLDLLLKLSNPKKLPSS